jgi:hypothetical protein
MMTSLLTSSCQRQLLAITRPVEVENLSRIKVRNWLRRTASQVLAPDVGGGTGHAVEAGNGSRRVLGTVLAGTFCSVGMYLWVKFDPTALLYVAISSKAQAMAENMYRALWSWVICVALR